MPIYFLNSKLKHWVESAGKYSTKSWSMFIPKTLDLNSDAVISPKGNGALLAQVPDGTVAGGNARGTRAIDLQLGRTNADEVAGANRSAILSGNSNKIVAGAGNSAILTGASNIIQATGQLTGIVSGWGNQSFSGSVLMGGITNTCYGEAGVVFGQSCQVWGAVDGSTSKWNVIAGGYQNKIGTDATSNVTYSAISGGLINTILMSVSAIAGGARGKIQARALSPTYYGGFIGGGESNTVESQGGVICGGFNNLNQSKYGFIGGGGGASVGFRNQIKCADSATYSAGNNAIVGGSSNVIDECYMSFIGGGTGNGIYSVTPAASVVYGGAIVGGQNNYIGYDGTTVTNTTWAFIGCGYNNKITGNGSAIVAGGDNTLAGSGNTITGVRSIIGNGTHHSITGNYSVICGGGTGTAGQGNTVSGSNGFIGNGAINSVAASDNAILNGNKVTITASRNSFLGAGSASNSTDYVTISGSNNIVGGTSGNFVVSGTGNVLLGTSGHAGRVFAGSNNVALGCNQPTIPSGTQYCFTASSTYSNFSACIYAWQIGTTSNSSVSHDFAGIMGGEANTRTHHSQATGYAKAQRHVSDFLHEGTTTANQTVTAIAIPSSGVLTKDAKSVLTIPVNSVMVGKLNFSVKEIATANVLAWIDAQVTIYKGTSTPVITVNKVDVVGSITGVTLSVVNSGTVANGIEFQITSVEAKTLRAKATFEYDLIID